MKFIDVVNSGVTKLSPYQAGKPIEELERELGISNIVKLASNENPFPFPQSARNAIIAELDDLSRYPDSNGFELKKTLAEKFSLNANQLTLGNGSNDLLELVAHTFATEGDEVILSQYAFIVYPLVSQAINAKSVVIPAKDYGHDLDGFKNAITAKTKLIYIANPNNPTGTFLPEREIVEFMKQVPEQVIVVLDEAYTEFANEGERLNSFALQKQFKNLVVCRTLSKAYGLAGLRIGYMVSDPEIADLFNRVRQPFNCNSVALAAARAVLNDRDYLQKVVENNHQGLQQLSHFFVEKQLDFIPSKGNFITVDVKQNAAPIYQQLLELGVIVRPIAGYGLPNHLRVSIGLPEENQVFIDALSKVLSL